MRRMLIPAMLVAAVASVVIGIAATASGRPNTARAPRPPPAHGLSAAAARPASRSALTADLVAARLATARYATNLGAAKADGYRILTKMIPNMGYHFINPKITGFDVRKPPILVYEHTGHGWQLSALEWVFTSMPAKAPLPGAKYGVFGAACHYDDGTVVFADAQSQVRRDGAGERCEVQLLASAPDHPALLGLVPELHRDLHGHQPDGGALQPQLTQAFLPEPSPSRLGGGPGRDGGTGDGGRRCVARHLRMWTGQMRRRGSVAALLRRYVGQSRPTDRAPGRQQPHAHIPSTPPRAHRRLCRDVAARRLPRGARAAGLRRRRHGGVWPRTGSTPRPRFEFGPGCRCAVLPSRNPRLPRMPSRLGDDP